MKKRATKTTKTRRYRLSKRNPQRPRVILKMDMGNVEQQITLTLPETAKLENREIPKEKNENLISFWFGTHKIAYYKDSGKGFIYDSDGIYSGKFEKHDLRRAFNKIGAILKACRKRNG